MPLTRQTARFESHFSCGFDSLVAGLRVVAEKIFKYAKPSDADCFPHGQHALQGNEKAH